MQMPFKSFSFQFHTNSEVTKHRCVFNAASVIPRNGVRFRNHESNSETASLFYSKRFNLMEKQIQITHIMYFAFTAFF
jgi:hypothetical protein